MGVFRGTPGLDEIAGRITEFIREEVALLGPDAVEITPSTDLMRGLIDSMGLLLLIAFLEDTFDIEVAAEDVTVENMGTVAAIAQFVQRHRHG